MLPDIHDYPAIVECIELREKLLTEKDKETIKHICRTIIDMIPDVTTQQKEYNVLYRKERPKTPDFDFVTGEPFKRLAIMYEKEGDFDRAINTCVLALSFDFNNDGTKGGFEGRIEKLKKKRGY